MTHSNRGPAEIHEHPALNGSTLPADVVERHIWMLDVLRKLHRYANQEGLGLVAERIIATSDALLDELRAQFRTPGPDAEQAGA